MRMTLALSAAILAGLAGCCPTPSSRPPAAEPVTVPVTSEEPKVVDPVPDAPASPYPATRRDAIVDELHGQQVADPYRWLEDAARPEVAAWMDGQDAYARGQLAALPGRDRIAARLKEVFYFDAMGAPTHRKGRYFYTRKLATQEKMIVYWKLGKGGAEQVLFDPNGWSTDGSTGLHGWWPSRDGKLVAYNKNEHNADEAVMYLHDVDSGKDLADVIPGTKYSGASWTPDGKGFYYTWVPPVGDKVTVADRPGLPSCATTRSAPIRSRTRSCGRRPATPRPSSAARSRGTAAGSWPRSSTAGTRPTSTSAI